MSKRVQPTPTIRTLDLDITDRLHDRVILAAAHEGMTVGAYLERAILAAVLDTEKRAARHDEAYRDAKDYPYVCEYCPARFKLPMHRARHVTWTHPEMAPQQDADTVEAEIRVAPLTPQQAAQVIAEAVANKTEVELPEQETNPEPDPRFKLAEGIDPDLMEEFDRKLAPPEVDDRFPPGDIPSL